MKNLVDLMTAKAIQSKVDGRMATFLNVDGDIVTLDMERIGLRKLPLNVVQSGFEFHMNYDSLVKAFLKKTGIRTDVPATDADVFEISCQVRDFMSRRFKDLTNLECYKAVRSYLPTI